MEAGGHELVGREIVPYIARRGCVYEQARNHIAEVLLCPDDPLVSMQ
ncbi:MAG TPA: hypothetical protein VGQ58_08285 [Candidatus Limnocylindrales bacterium]|nr:hypothetical protein [Candidatus Limnocylindrales bacterium]